MRPHSNPEMRRYSFDIPLPARVDKADMAQRKNAQSMGVLMSAPLPMIVTDGREVTFKFQVDRPTVTIDLSCGPCSIFRFHPSIHQPIHPSIHPSTHRI